MDGVLMINEILYCAKKVNRSCMMVKVDFEKACDCVSWNFLRFLLVRMGFRARWRMYMEALIFNSSISVLVNGSLTDNFVVSKGLRQEDPLSHFLFLLVAEGLLERMRTTSLLGEVVGFRFNDLVHFEILQFADDNMLIDDGSWENLWIIKALHRGFKLVLGLRIKLYKSRLVGVNLDSVFVQVVVFRWS
ncbi:unnamed protein product [Lathyrus sativus]|nr:unnamed protein product [Lathyrus sativus]